MNWQIVGIILNYDNQNVIQAIRSNMFLWKILPLIDFFEIFCLNNYELKSFFKIKFYYQDEKNISLAKDLVFSRSLICLLSFITDHEENDGVISLIYNFKFLNIFRIMKNNKNFNVRQVIRSPNSPNLQSPLPKESIKEEFPEGSNSFDKFFSMFKTFMEENKTFNKQTQINPQHDYELEPRDREVFIEPPQLNVEEKIDMSDLKAWTTEVVKKTFSSAFNGYYKEYMSFEQAKIYCSENVFKNIVRLSQRYRLKGEQLQAIDYHIKNGVLPYLGAKYPLTESSQVNKKLEAALRKVDTMESVSNNYFTNNPIVFEYRDSGNYNDLIMEMINDLISKVEPSNNKNNFQDFEKCVSDIFEKVEDQDWVKNQHPQRIHSIGIMSIDKQTTKAQQINPQKLRKRQEEKDKYRAQVKEYTHYLIGRKITQNTPLYSESDIKSGNIEIKSHQILRILTKWCEELEEKYKNRYFLNRSQMLKAQKGDKIANLSGEFRKYIDDQLQKYKLQIDNAMKQLSENNYEMQANILEYELSRKGDEHIDLAEKISGKFSYKITKNLHQYIIIYLNRLIHGLLQVAKKKMINVAGDSGNWPFPPCLLSFKVGDLMRCKCHSKEKQILMIYEEINRMSQEHPEKLKIVRIKNRLRSGTNDILMNVRFNDSVLCEIQLAIDSRSSSFIKCSNSFHHYLYELERSLFGPLSELCSIWNSFDKRMSLYQQLIEGEQNEFKHKVPHVCQNKSKGMMLTYQKPFICSSCKKTYNHSRFIKKHFQCKTCKFIVCAKCRLDEDDVSKNTALFIEAKQLIDVCGQRIQRQSDLPKFGICIFIKSKKSKPILFTTLFNRGVDYLLKKQGQVISQIFKFRTKQDKQQFRNNHNIFEVKKNDLFQPISQREAQIKYIVPLLTKENFKKQKETINLMGFKFTNEQCQQILSGGPQQSKRSVRSLNLDQNKIEKLPVDANQFPNLEQLSLRKNKFKSLEGISQFKYLRKLSLQSCDQQEIFDQVYECKYLQELQAGQNNLEFIDNKIANLTNLKVLTLTLCNLKTINDKIFECKLLVQLNLNQNYLTEVSSAIQRLQNLENLCLFSNYLTKVAYGIGKLKKLKFLDLSNNSKLSQSLRLTELNSLQSLNVNKTKISQIVLPKEGLQKLKKLDISYSQIKYLPVGMQKSTMIQIADFNSLPVGLNCENISVANLRKFYFYANDSPMIVPLIPKMTLIILICLSNNKFPDIQLNFSNLHSLQTLQIQSCNLNIFPKLTNCSSLKQLIVNSNQLTNVPDDCLENLFDLEYLAIMNNKLEKLPKSLLDLKNLTHLYAGDNCLTSLFESGFEETIDPNAQYFPNLKKLSLSGNKLTEIPSIICNSPSLQYLDLRKNSIQRIRPQIAKLTKLNYFYLSTNKIESIPAELVQIRNLQYIDLQDNLITCIPKFFQDMSQSLQLKITTSSITTIQCIDWCISLGNNSQIRRRAQDLKQEEEKKIQLKIQQEKQKKQIKIKRNI